nr:MAG TPA: hypothetical protein [Caudoviricetes sp.]
MVRIGWNSNVSRESHTIALNYGLNIHTLSLEELKEWVIPSCWEEELFDQLNQMVPLLKAYSFSVNKEKHFFAFVKNPTTENILRLSESYYDFIDKKNGMNSDFYCEFLVFGEEEEEFLQIPNTAKKITRS